jgi:TPR repeat protein
MVQRLLTILLAVLSQSVVAGDFEDAIAAYDRQEYKVSLVKFTKAAEDGNASAQNNLGFMYEHGQGVVQNYKEAVRWYALSARQGNAAAQANLAGMYKNGRGVARDLVRAHMWYNISGTDGDKNSVANRDEVASKMTVRQIEQAQGMARECTNSNYKNCN